MRNQQGLWQIEQDITLAPVLLLMIESAAVEQT